MAVAKHVRRDPPLLQRRAYLGSDRDVLGKKILHAISAQALAPCTWKHCRVSPVRYLPQPSLQNGYGLLGERRRAFLAALSKHANVGVNVDRNPRIFED